MHLGTRSPRPPCAAIPVRLRLGPRTPGTKRARTSCLPLRPRQRVRPPTAKGTETTQIPSQSSPFRMSLLRQIPTPSPSARTTLPRSLYPDLLADPRLDRGRRPPRLGRPGVHARLRSDSFLAARPRTNPARSSRLCHFPSSIIEQPTARIRRRHAQLSRHITSRQHPTGLLIDFPPNRLNRPAPGSTPPHPLSARPPHSHTRDPSTPSSSLWPAPQFAAEGALSCMLPLPRRQIPSRDLAPS